MVKRVNFEEINTTLNFQLGFSLGEVIDEEDDDMESSSFIHTNSSYSSKINMAASPKSKSSNSDSVSDGGED
jgi:hypothetical protein